MKNSFFCDIFSIFPLFTPSGFSEIGHRSKRFSSYFSHFPAAFHVPNESIICLFKVFSTFLQPKIKHSGAETELPLLLLPVPRVVFLSLSLAFFRSLFHNMNFASS
jgi:hypothetical protein